MKKLLLAILFLTFSLTLTGCVYEGNCDCTEVTFQLEGDNIMELMTGETFNDPGFIATLGASNLEEFVTVEGTVDNRTVGVYFLEYTLEYSGETYSLLRAVNVVEQTAVADPDLVLYDGTCDTMQIHFIDIESMGDSTLIDCGDYEILIDAGLKSAGTEVIVPYLENYVTDGVLEMVIATHPDADHIGGFVGLADQDGIFDAFTVEYVLDYGYTKSTVTHEQYAELRDASGAKVCSGSEAINAENLCQPYFTITEDLILRVVDTGHYNGEDTTNDNENSVVVLLEHGDLKYLFTGDAEGNAEYIMAGNLGKVDVYKAGHHGSNTASSQVFLNAIDPDTIILGVYFPDDDDGENGYGIPQQDSVDRLLTQTTNIYATGVSGTLILTSDGSSYSITGSLNNTLFQNSTWFSTHRTAPGE